MHTVSHGPWEGLEIASGRYTQLNTLGEGGMGYVYRALDGNLQTHVVIKSPRRELMQNPEQIGRFEREIRAMIRLSYPHIVPVIDVGRHDGVPFAVMRFLSGGNLEDRMGLDQAGHPLAMPPGSLADWLLSISQALDFVHQQGYLHRDVKPQNILFDQHQHAYLSDFGVIKALGENDELQSSKLTGQGFVLGTVDYMAPELLTGQAPDGRADQYALAVTVYQVLSARLPFEGNSAAAVMVQHVNQPPKPLKQLAPHLSAELAQAVERGLAKSPAQRYGTCVEFAQRVLQAAATGSSPAIAARPQPAATGQARPPAGAGLRRATAAEPVAAMPSSANRTASVRAPAASGGKATAVVSVLRPGAAAKAAPPPARSSSTWWMVGGVLALSALALSGLAFMLLPGSGDAGDTQYEELATSSLPRLISQWEEHAGKVEQKLVVDSRPLVDDPKYASSDEFKKLLNSHARKPSNSAEAEFEALDRDLAAIRKLRDRLAQEVNRRAEQHLSDQGGSGAAPSEELVLEQRALQDEESRLAAMDRRLESMRGSASTAAKNYDARALTEIATLDEMHRIADAGKPTKLSESTLKRAKELLDCKYPPLAWLALNALVRGGDSRASRSALQQLSGEPTDRQAQLCWSLLVSGKAESVNAAARQLEADAAAAAQLDRAKLLDLVADEPTTYAPIIVPLATWCKTSDERLRLARIQVSEMNEAWMPELEQSCASGLLRDDTGTLVVEIVAHQCQAAYPLAERLLEKHHGLKLDALTPDELAGALDREPELGSRLAEQLLINGTAEQRKVSLKFLREPAATIDARKFGQRLDSERLREPTELLNMLVSADDARSLDLAEAVLQHGSGLVSGQIDFPKVSSAALEREPIRLALAKLAVKVPDTGRGWALQQVLGPDFTKLFREAEATRGRQSAAAEQITNVLNGKQTSIKGHGSSSVIAGKGLEVAAGDMAALKTDFKSADWAPGGAAEKALQSLREQLSKIRASAGTLYDADLAQVDQYLEHMQQLNQVAFQLAGIYDLTVGQQLVGARREIQKKRHPAWSFRFTQTNIDAYEQQLPRYEAVDKAIRAERQALPAFLRKPPT